MKHLIAIILLSFCWMTGAHARMSVASPTVFSFCPFGDVGNGSNPDGCGQAPQPGLTPSVSGQVWHKDCFAVGGFINQYAGTSSNYTTAGHRPSENMPGCDYPVGSTIPDASLLDPATWANPATNGCTYNATGGLSGTNGTLTCGGSLWKGFNGLMMGPIGTHGCTALVLNNSGAGANPVVISNSHFLNDGNCAASSILFALINGPSTTYPIIYKNLTVDGAGQQFPQPCSSSVVCSANQGIQTKGGSITGQYNAVVNFGSKSIIYNNSDVTQPFVWQYNFGAGWMMNGNIGDHAEFATDQDTIGSSNRLVDHNVIVQATLNNASAFAPWAQGLSGGFTVAGPFEFDSNVVVAAFTGGMPSSVTSMTGVIGCGNPPTCSTHGSQFYITAVTGGAGIVGTGPQFTCAGILGELAPVNMGGGATSAGIGGAYTGGAGAWFGMNLGGSGQLVTGFIDDGSGHGTFSGISGNVLTVTGVGVDPAVGYSITSKANTITATVANGSNQLVVTGVPTGVQLVVGTVIAGSNIPANTTISSLSPSGTGTTGTYTLSASATAAQTNPTEQNTVSNSTSVSAVGATITVTPSQLVAPSIQNMGGVPIFAGSWTMPPTTCTSSSLITASTPVGFLSAHNANIQGASEVRKNFIDISSGSGAVSFVMDNPGASCTSPTVFGGNVNMNTGNLDTLMNQWTTPGTGC